jgi:hypothetical protein
VPVEDIHAEREENRRDVTAYLHRAWEQDPDLRQKVQAWGAEWNAAAFAAHLGERGEWNFLYLRGVLPLIARGEVQDPHKLPAGLDAFYAYLLHTRIGEKEWGEWGADLLETLLALQEPATPEHLARLLDWEVAQLMTACCASASCWTRLPLSRIGTGATTGHWPNSLAAGRVPRNDGVTSKPPTAALSITT